MFSQEPPAPTSSTGLIDAARRYSSATIAITLAGLLLGFLAALILPSPATAVAQMTLSDPRGTTIFNQGGGVQVEIGRYMADRASFAQSPDVLATAADSWPDGDADTLRRNCSVSPLGESTTLEVKCAFSSKKTATSAVDALTRAYESATRTETDTTAQRALDALSADRNRIIDELNDAAAQGGDTAVVQALIESSGQRLAQIESRETDIRTTQALFDDGVDTRTEARILPSAGLFARLLRYGFIGGVFGLVTALVAAWFRADRSPIAVDGDSISDALGMPILGEVARDRNSSVNLTAASDPTYQLLFSNLGSVFDSGVLLCSPLDPLPEYAQAVIRTALVGARGRRVLLIDVDVENRRISRALGVKEGPGLAQFIAGQIPEESVAARVSFGSRPGLSESVLYLMGPGQAGDDVGSLLRTELAHHAFAHLKERYDLVIVGAPPLLESAVTTAAGRLADGAVVFVERGIPVSRLTRARRQLDFLGTRNVGFVLMGAQSMPRATGSDLTRAD